jgi:glycopeptide antibiotics resistance protein
MSPPAPDRRSAFLAFLAYLAFVVYGSLVPFEPRAVPFELALKNFAAIAYLDLGIESRADWIANIVLYVPLGFLGCAWAVGLRSFSPWRHLAAAAVFGFCVGTAVAVEFTQIFFAPRTVSLNDLLAETLGSLGGIALFVLGRWRLARLWDSFARGGRGSLIAVGAAYFMAYLALSLFPYDFVISPAELAWKLRTGLWGWLLVGDCHGLACLARQVGEVVAIAPLGVLAALAAPGLGYRRLFLVGAVLGLFLESSQLLLASGVSQGLSLLWRGLGLAAGAAAGHLLRRLGPEPMARAIRRAIPFAALPYLLLLAGMNGWLSSVARPALAAGLARLAEVRFIPFYYHYFTTEAAAMTSLLAVACIYAPVGLAAWAARPARQGRGGSGVPAAALWGALLALPVEFGKLWVPPKHPDPTDLLIAAASAAMVRALANWIELNLLGGGEPEPANRAPPTAAILREPARAPTATAPQDWPTHPAGIAAGCAAAATAAAGIAWYPLGTPWLAAALLGYGALLWRRPSLLFFALPALLPTLDLRPLTGDLLLNEFDLAVLATLAVGYWRVYGLKPAPWPSRWLPAALALLWASWAAASYRSPWPLPELAHGLPGSSHSALEGWQVGKGLLWALLLAPLMRRVPSENAAAMQGLFLSGVVAGLTAETLVVLWERHIFVGIGDFDNVFRVTGTFADMRTGGAYIEAFLAYASPPLAAWTLLARTRLLKAAGVATAALACHAMLVTFSRGGYGGLAAGLAPIALCALRPQAAGFRGRWLLLAGLAAASTAAALPVLSGGFAPSRLARSAEDMDIRLAHWQRALGLMDTGSIAALTGMGFGQYPSLYLLRSEGSQPPGTFNLMREGGNPYLRLGAGEPSYLEQVVDIRPGTRYSLSARIRQAQGSATLDAFLCEKALLYSFECVKVRLASPAGATQWSLASAQVDSDSLGSGRRPVKLSLFQGTDGAPIDVDAVSLKGPDGRERVANGNFSRGATRWLFASDPDPSWHIHQMDLEIYFAQGELGLAALAALLAAAGRALWPALLAGNFRAAGLAGGLLGLLAVGLLGSVMDSARLSMLFYLGAFVAAILTRPENAGASRMEKRES